MKFQFAYLFFSLLFCLGCSRISLDSYTISIAWENDNLDNGILKLNKSESKEVHYEIENFDRKLKDIKIQFHNLPSTITTKVSSFTSASNTYGEDELHFTVTYISNEALAGNYEVKLYAEAKGAIVKDISQSIEVLDFQVDDLLGITFQVNDSLSLDPFYSGNVSEVAGYNMHISKKIGGANNEFVMDYLGQRGPTTIFTQMHGIIDTISGDIIIPSQTIFSTVVSGYGKIVYTPQLFINYSGFIMYKYTNTLGEKYEGKALF